MPLLAPLLLHACADPCEADPKSFGDMGLLLMLIAVAGVRDESGIVHSRARGAWNKKEFRSRGCAFMCEEQFQD